MCCQNRGYVQSEGRQHMQAPSSAAPVPALLLCKSGRLLPRRELCNPSGCAFRDTQNLSCSGAPVVHGSALWLPWSWSSRGGEASAQSLLLLRSGSGWLQCEGLEVAPSSLTVYFIKRSCSLQVKTWCHFQIKVHCWRLKSEICSSVTVFQLEVQWTYSFAASLAR